jgi:uncharacterized integral membrane protein
MRVRSWVALILLVLACGLFVLNWRVLTATANVNFLIGSANAPLGVVMLVLCGLLIAVLATYVGIWHGTLLAELRRQAKELDAQRALAESAETSRFTDLGTLIRSEIANSDKRLEAALDTLRTELRDTENSIAATLGEMDDRLRQTGDRKLQ